MHEIKKWLAISSHQLDRLRISWSDMLVADKKLPKTSAWISDPGIPDWVKAQNVMWGDLHFLYVSLNNLFKAIQKANDLPETIKEMGAYKELRADIQNLRDIHEHWDIDESKLRALKKFRNTHRNTDPRAIGLIPFKKFEAGGLDINEVQSLILKLENELEV